MQWVTTILGLVVCLSATFACAGMPPDQLPTNPGQFDESIFGDLNRGMLKGIKGKNTEEVFRKTAQAMQGDPTHVSLCPACKKPMHMHVADAGFVCLPDNALSIQEIKAACPVCKAVFTAAYKANVNNRAGLDRDFCPHAVGQEVVVHASVWLCPDCGYAGPSDRLGADGKLVHLFGKEVDGSPLNEKTIQFVHERLSAQMFQKMTEIANLNNNNLDTKRKLFAEMNPGQPFNMDAVLKMDAELKKFSTYIRQTDIPDWIKYKNAVLLMENAAVKPTHMTQAQMYIDGAWACRRHVCSEIGISGLVQEFQEHLSKSINRMKYYVKMQCISVRKRGGEDFVDPSKTELDPFVLAQASEEIIVIGERVVQEEEKSKQRPGLQPTQSLDQSRFSVGDIFVLRLFQAGYLDRCGRIADALDALGKARNAIPSSAEIRNRLKQDGADENRNVQLFLKQLELNLMFLHRSVDSRLEGLQLEREWIYQGAEHLMQALHYDESSSLGPGMTEYWAGELYRRDGREPESAEACFDTALKILRKEDLPGLRSKAEELEQTRRNPLEPTEQEQVLRQKLARLNTLMGWCEDNLVLTAKAKQEKLARRASSLKGNPAQPGILPLRDNLKAALSKLLMRAGVQDVLGTAQAGTPTPQTPDLASPPNTTVKEPVGEPAVVGASPFKTRAEMFHRYHQAFTAYKAAKKENPKVLQDMVDGGFLKREEAQLEANGRVRCPETGQKLLYARAVELGTHHGILLPGPTDKNQTKLYADGKIGE